MPGDTRSLWEQFDSEVEPWRRGRAVLIVIAVCYFALQALVVVTTFAFGDFDRVFAFLTGCVIFWLSFYFIWIGVNWIRWLSGAWSGLVGFCWLMWGIRDSNMVLATFGTANLFVAAYFCLSSSVYFFALRQRERRNWLHTIVVAAVFGLLTLTTLLASVGVSAYKARIEAEARDFADDAFVRIFIQHDSEFFLANVTENILRASGGRDRVVQFIERTRFNPGQIDQLKPATARLKMNYTFPVKLTYAAEIITTGVTIYGHIQLHLWIIDSGTGWQIESVWWNY